MISRTSLSLRERGLKCKIFAVQTPTGGSLSLRERGLKLINRLRSMALLLSLSLRERGLKLYLLYQSWPSPGVALLARAWIEMSLNQSL